MNKTEKSRERIYKDILQQVESLLGNFEFTDKNPVVADVLDRAKKIIIPQKKELERKIIDLKKHAKWDSFVIAFYGETNAGKSTIIETLRIFLNESKKVEERKKIQEEVRKINAEHEEIKTIVHAIEDCITQIVVLKEEYDVFLARHEAERRGQDQQLAQIHDLLLKKKESLSFWRRFINVFRELPEEMELKNRRHQLVLWSRAGAAEKQALESKIESKTKEYEKQVEVRTKKEQVLNKLVESMAFLADGAIIGTGESDFTRDLHEYTFTFGHQAVTLLDVPGIEGSEKPVMDSISAAVKSAHAVFYVTSKAAAPQTGDEHSEGTLEKIRKHLGDQTEVWSIYNKRVTSPRVLLESPLLSEDENSSLAVMDDILREHLGANHYQQHFAVSAYPAFLAVASHVMPESHHAKQRAKFLEHADTNAWFDKSGFAVFTNWLMHSMVKNSQVRIHNSNINKVSHAVFLTVDKIGKFQATIAKPRAQQIKSEWISAEKRLKVVVDTFGAALRNDSSNDIDGYIHKVRKSMYERIDGDIDNDKVRPLLQATLEREQKSLQDALQASTEKQLKEFQGGVKNILTQFKEHAEEIGKFFRSTVKAEFGGAFDLKMSFDSGINYTGLFSSIAGGVAAAVLTGGWALAIGMLGAIVGVVKSVLSWFSSDYKKSQQRKAVDENLRKVRKHLDSSVEEKCVELAEETKNIMTTIANEIGQSVANMERVNRLLVGVNGNLSRLAKQLSS